MCRLAAQRLREAGEESDTAFVEGGDQIVEQFEATAADLTEKIDRYRKALEEIKAMCGTKYKLTNDGVVMTRAKDIATQALEEGT